MWTIAHEAVLRRQPFEERIRRCQGSKAGSWTGSTSMKASRPTFSTIADPAHIPAFCTDRLSSVFRLGDEPFVSPSGARLDDLLNAVRRCPSGALGIGIGPARDASMSDTARAPQIEVSKDGPYRVTGRIELLDEEGADHCAECRRVAGALQPLPVRILAQQAVLQWNALERRISRSCAAIRCASRRCSSGRVVIRRCWT